MHHLLIVTNRITSINYPANLLQWNGNLFLQLVTTEVMKYRSEFCDRLSSIPSGGDVFSDVLLLAKYYLIANL